MNQHWAQYTQSPRTLEMRKIELYGIKLDKEVGEGASIGGLVVEGSNRQGCGIEEGDVVVVTSKVVSKAESRMVGIADITPSRKARIIAKYFHKLPQVIELYMREGKIVGVIPLEKISQRHRRLFEEYSKDKRITREILSKDPYMFLVKVGNRVLTEGGIDFSNAPEGYCTLLPKDPDESARRLRADIMRLTTKEVAVVITDTEIKLDKFGTVDIAVGSAGIEPVTAKFGCADIYGKPKIGGIDDLTDLVAASANLLMGQTDEAVPSVIVRGLQYEKSEKGVKDVLYSGEGLKGSFGIFLWENLKLRAVSNSFISRLL